ncbi:MAG TPA: hypothetical protein V6D47_17260 [Oscillatoriaceae cyanobacterium]
MKNFPASKAPQQESNWPFAVIAVLMAIVLWLFVRTGAQPLNQTSVYLPIAVVNDPRGLTIVPDRVEVKLEANSSLIDRLSPDEVAVIADLGRHREGDLVTLTVVPPQGFKVLSTSVSQVRVVEKSPTIP